MLLVTASVGVFGVADAPSSVAARLRVTARTAVSIAVDEPEASAARLRVTARVGVSGVTDAPDAAAVEGRLSAELDPLRRRLGVEGEAQAAGQTVAEIEAKRNAVLVDMMKVFKKHKIGAGLVLDRELKARKKAKAK